MKDFLYRMKVDEDFQARILDAKDDDALEVILNAEGFDFPFIEKRLDRPTFNDMIEG
jgi:hypothetical protein